MIVLKLSKTPTLTETVKIVCHCSQLLVKNYQPVSIPLSVPEFCSFWPWKSFASGWGSFWESSSFVPWFIPDEFRVGSGVVPEPPGSSGFIRKSSSLASAPKMRFSVLLNSFDNLFVTLPSISSETWVM